MKTVRALYNGNTEPFQGSATGSTPVARSIPPPASAVLPFEKGELLQELNQYTYSDDAEDEECALKRC